jgi:type I restriction-modification system DNA methylase subunit
MPLFQKSVISKYFKSQGKDTLSEKWNTYKNHFLNPSVQADIRNLKEEQYQGEFLEDLFVKILGYTKPASSSETKFNLTTEYKNVKDSKKADGAIIFEDKVKAVIELKGTNTTDLGKIEDQAFGYKNNQPDCVYIITSNFEKLRFYIDNAIEHIEFNLFTLTEEEFQLLYLCLGFDNLSHNVAKKIKDESLSQEDVITKNLYRDYSLFKRELHQNLVLLNPDFNPLVLFRKSQKLLDRFLFLFFGEDRNLLPPNSVRLILTQWNQLRELDEYSPLYNRFKKYFGYLNTGHKGVQHNVFAYNGGLFKPDEILDSISIDDDLLYKHTLKLSEYDFASEVDVNILGHIFENSLNELEEIKAQLEGQEIDKSKTKRKKDGVFYTPKYITKYIVENTVGKLCEEKKLQLGIGYEVMDQTYTTKGKNPKLTNLGKNYILRLNEYRTWLLNLKICDPACGSGAFLNQSLEFLISEHNLLETYVLQMQKLLTGEGDQLTTGLRDITDEILENNLFGVDINEESVEIAKLSLWLRTAQPNRKLNDLNGNIKCGNSLIDDATVAGDKAFNWQQAFPKVFDKGGFDVVIGNPPYVDMRSILSQDIKYFKNKYNTASNRINLFGLFVEHSFNIMKKKSEYGMIIHRNLIRSNEYEKCRELILNKTELNSILSFKNGVFDGVTGEMTILTFAKKINLNLNNKVKILNYELKIENDINETFINQDIFNKCLGKRFNVYITKEKTSILNKIISNYIYLGDISYTLQGIIAGDEKKYISRSKLNDDYKPILRGRDINRYKSDKPYEYIYFIEGTKVLTRSRKRENFEHPDKILTQHVSGGINACLDEDQLYYMQTINGTILTDKNYNSKYILSILNSNVIAFYYDNIFNIGAEFTTAVAIENLDLIPIRNITLINQKPFIEKADLMLSMNKELQEQSQKFQRTIQRKFEFEVLPKKLQDWYLLSYAEFIKELGKKKVNLSLSQEAEWEDHFLEESKKALELKATIDATDKAIDTMVYELYGLNEEEIAIVEAS